MFISVFMYYDSSIHVKQPQLKRGSVCENNKEASNCFTISTMVYRE